MCIIDGARLYMNIFKGNNLREGNSIATRFIEQASVLTPKRKRVNIKKGSHQVIDFFTNPNSRNQSCMRISFILEKKA